MKMFERLQAKKKDNKGFSLVELIIVIAIMAILVGVVGTQVVPYLEKSRKAKDTQILSAWNTDAMTAYSSNAAILDAAKVYTITITGGATGKVVVTDDASGTSDGGSADKACVLLRDGFCELNGTAAAGGYDFDDMESKAGKDISSVVITCGDSAYIIETTVNNATADTYTWDPIHSN